MIPPPRRQRHVVPTALFVAPASTVSPPEPAGETGPIDPTRESLNIWPHVVLHLYANGTAGAQSPIRDATWERLVLQAQQRAEQLRSELSFIERWLAAPGNPENQVELKP